MAFTEAHVAPSDAARELGLPGVIVDNDVGGDAGAILLLQQHAGAEEG